MENQRDTTHDTAMDLDLVGVGIGFRTFGPAGMIIGGALGVLAGATKCRRVCGVVISKDLMGESD